MSCRWGENKKNCCITLFVRTNQYFEPCHQKGDAGNLNVIGTAFLTLLLFMNDIKQ
ncbi:hypothetical protein DY78_GL001743 [Lactiplantibacillus fabifermentans DSM 21115]|uniref:Uncharacterized protein n=1 Tax=Lactiplantibacillus fabifermentans DSM 21115 TaxID=1413187 RepID=A0A0R2NL57_9LACO|nr:hypothetical protein DY78_GL001743 [Lactiplantibacillus fabifermentans DSM 21115]